MITLTGKEKASYGAGAVAKDMVYSLVAGFLMYYYNTVLGISASFIGVLFMAARLFDAINDPVMGVIIDKTKSPIGKFRPWLLVGTATNAVVLYLMFSIPANLAGNSLLIYASVAYLAWGITYTMMDIPYWSMIPALTEPGRGRENLSVIARSAAGFGFALPVGLTMVLVPLLGGGSERAGFSRVALIVAVVFVIGILITTIQVKEKNPAAGKSPRVRDLFRALVKNDQALVVVVSIVVFNASLYLTNQLALYFFRFDIGNAALFGVFGTVGGAAQILAMLTIPLLRKKFSSKSILVGGILTTMTGYALLFVMGSLSITNMALLSVAAIIIFMGFGIATVLTTVFLANTVDYGEWKNGQRTESVIFSLQTFVVKLASAFSVLIAGVGLDLVGLDVDAAVQTDATLLGLRFLMVVVPMIGLAFAIIYFVRFYKLGDDQLTEITGELANRRES